MLRIVSAMLLALTLFPALARADDAGFKPLFDGKTLEGWQGATNGYFVENEAIVCDPKKGGFLYTDKEYDNFVLRFEFKLTPGANNGLGLRAPMGSDPAYSGMELQVLDNTADQYKNLKEYQYHGSVYGVAAAKRGHLKPVGEWNVQEVTLDGRDVKVVLNGETIVDVNLDEVTKDGTVDGRDHPGLKREKGYICFCGHGTRVDFRKVMLKELK